MQTIYACFIGYIVQAIVNNFVPLLFVTFQNNYHISLERITFLITLNFIIQLFVDLLSAFFIDRIGYRISILIAHILSAAGLILLTVLPEVFSSPYTGLVIAVIIYAIGGGLLEVLVSPIIEACPTDNKEKAMSPAFLLLLGACGRCSVINRIFLVFRNIALENPRTYVGCHPNI